MQSILIDGRFVGVGDSMTRYTLETLKRLLPLDKENKYTILLRPQGLKVLDQWIKGDLRKRLKTEVLDIPHYSMSEQSKLLHWLNEKKFDLVHFVQFNHPIRYRGKFVITIHDLTLLGHLHRMNFARKLGFRVAMKSAVKNSSKIITVSQTSKDDIVDYYKIDPNKIVVTHLAVDDRYTSNLKSQISKIRKFKEKYKIVGDYILYTGMWQRHKNLLRLMRAFEQVKKQSPRDINQINIQLVLVGKIDKDEPEILKEIDRINSSLHLTSHISQPIVTTGFIDEEELPLAYAGALAYCIPSLSEGFGLPPLEAMASGTPVISSNISAMPEILGKAPLYFDPYDVDDMAKAMAKVIKSKELRDQLSRRGLEQVKKYNWQDTAEKTLCVYKSVL